MIKLWAAVVPLALLAACSASSGGPTATTAPSGPILTSSADRFTALVNTPKYENAGLMAYASTDLLTLARRQCHDFDGLDTASDRSAAASDLIRVGWTALAAAALVDAAHRTVC